MFGANSGLVVDMYEQFVEDPSSVSESWREFFADYHSQAPSVAAAAATSTQVQAVVAAYRGPDDTGGQPPATGNGAANGKVVAEAPAASATPAPPAASGEPAEGPANDEVTET